MFNEMITDPLYWWIISASVVAAISIYLAINYHGELANARRHLVRANLEVEISKLRWHLMIGHLADGTQFQVMAIIDNGQREAAQNNEYLINISEGEKELKGLARLRYVPVKLSLGGTYEKNTDGTLRPIISDQT